MPELPEVETIVRGLRRKVEGRAISKTWGIPTSKSLVGKRILSVRRRAKYLVLSLEDGSTVLVHLGMTGRLLYSDSLRQASKHTRAFFIFENGGQLTFDDARKFGKVKLYRREHTIPEIEGLGPEPLEPGFSVQALARVMEKTKRRVKDLLMDQRVIAGLGNIYVHEILFASGVHPFAPSCSLPQRAVRSLHENIKEVLKRAIAKRGTTLSDYRDVEGREGTFQDSLQVYGREKCPRCHRAIERVKLSGRSTYYCPRCQRV